MPDIISNLFAYYELDDNTDSTSNGYDWTENGTMTYSSAKVGNGGDFDGSTDSLSRTAGVGDDFNIGNNQWAVSLWVLFDAGALGRQSDLSGHNFNDWLITKTNIDRPRFLVKHGSGQNVTEINPGVSAATWYHLFVSYDGTDINIRWNDTTASSTTMGDIPLDRAATVWLGRGASGSNLHDGQLDEVAYWKGYVPTASEITSLYNSGNGLSYAQFLSTFGDSGIPIRPKMRLPMGLNI